VAPLEVVIGEELIEVGLDLLDTLEPGRASRDMEALVEHCPVHPFHEAVVARGADLGGAMLDPFHRGQPFVRVHLRTSAELAFVVGENRPDRNAQGLVERKDPVIEQIARGDQHYRVVELGEGDRAEGVDDDLDVDLAHYLKRPPV
jgi:hypothetical protein